MFKGALFSSAMMREHGSLSPTFQLHRDTIKP